MPRTEYVLRSEVFVKVGYFFFLGRSSSCQKRVLRSEVFVKVGYFFFPGGKNLDVVFIAIEIEREISSSISVGCFSGDKCFPLGFRRILDPRESEREGGAIAPHGKDFLACPSASLFRFPRRARRHKAGAFENVGHAPHLATGCVRSSCNWPLCRRQPAASYFNCLWEGPAPMLASPWQMRIACSHAPPVQSDVSVRRVAPSSASVAVR